MWELDYEEDWTPKNWCFWTVVLEKTLESPLVCKEIQPVHSKGDQSWVFIGRTDAKAETPILGPPHVKSWLIGKDSDAGRDWGQEEKGATQDEMAGWHHWLNGQEFGWTPGVGDEQGGLTCCNSWGCKESDMTEQLNWTELKNTIEKALINHWNRVVLNVDSSLCDFTWFSSTIYTANEMAATEIYNNIRKYDLPCLELVVRTNCYNNNYFLYQIW